MIIITRSLTELTLQNNFRLSLGQDNWFSFASVQEAPLTSQGECKQLSKVQMMSHSNPRGQVSFNVYAGPPPEIKFHAIAIQGAIIFNGVCYG